MKGFFLYPLALFIDFLQLGLGLFIIMLQFLPIIGQAALPFAIGIDEALTLTLGSVMILSLALTRSFSLGAVMGGSAVEIIPILNLFIPGWTLMTWRCLKISAAKEAAKKKTATSRNETQIVNEALYANVA